MVNSKPRRRITTHPHHHHCQQHPHLLLSVLQLGEQKPSSMKTAHRKLIYHNHTTADSKHSQQTVEGTQQLTNRGERHAKTEPIETGHHGSTNPNTQTLRARQQQQQQQQQQQSDDEQRQSKRIKIEAAPDGSASLVVSSVHPSQLHPSYYYYHQQQQQRHQNYPTTVAPTSLFSSPSSTSSFNPLQSCSNNQDSPLVSATTQEYGRVIMKKDALINKLGLEAAHRAIRKASSKRKPYHLDHLLSSSASPPSSPQTDCWRTGTIAKWLESPDGDDEDEEDDNSLLGLEA
ncbi:hypothetical protein H4Q26_003519 [Puccinia striiformis f. sp. tritici PST-130]|nr:hypothetical protein H4Q26_003519 [Puccinia striiformis f. sp. tritici PST-130]